MPSSTSSSDAVDTHHPASDKIVRQIPGRPWGRILVLALTLTVLAVAAYEAHARHLGYAPTYNDTPNLWAPLREAASSAGPEQWVFVGASRTLFDADLGVFEDVLGGPPPLQLATVGSNPMIIFSHLADDPTYRGSTLVGIVPGLLMASGGPPVEHPQKFVDHYETWSPASRFELPLSLWLQDRFAFIQQEDLTLPARLKQLPISNRPDANLPPLLPPYFQTIERDRQTRMIPSVTLDSPLGRTIQQRWPPLFTPPPPPPIFTPEQFAEIMQKAWEDTLARAKANVQTIEGRGGRVVFVRWPSSHDLRALEAKLTPRERVWDPLLAATGALGIHFEDYPELANYQCPEWSHLSATNATRFSRKLAQILRDKL